MTWQPMLHVWLSDANPELPYVVVTEGSESEWYGEVRCANLTQLVNEIAAKVNRGELIPRDSDARRDAASPAAVADGPVSDTPEPVTPEAGRPVAEPDRDDADVMSHTR